MMSYSLTLISVASSEVDAGCGIRDLGIRAKRELRWCSPRISYRVEVYWTRLL